MPVRGMSLRNAKHLWIVLGGTVRDRHGTGEEVYWHPEQPKPITVHKRRQDAPRKLTTALIRLWRGRRLLGTAV